MLICGILSAALLGFYIEKTLNYSRVFKVIGVIALVESFGFPLVLSFMPHNFGVTMVFLVIMGTVFIPFMPLTFDYSCDILFPAG